MAELWRRGLGAGTGQQEPQGHLSFVHFTLSPLRNLPMAQMVLSESGWGRDTLCLVFGCDKICAPGLSRVPLLDERSISKL